MWAGAAGLSNGTSFAPSAATWLFSSLAAVVDTSAPMASPGTHRWRMPRDEPPSDARSGGERSGQSSSTLRERERVRAIRTSRSSGCSPARQPSAVWRSSHHPPRGRGGRSLCAGRIGLSVFLRSGLRTRVRPTSLARRRQDTRSRRGGSRQSTEHPCVLQVTRPDSGTRAALPDVRTGPAVRALNMFRSWEGSSITPVGWWMLPHG